MLLSQICKLQEGYVNPSQKNQKFFDGEIKWVRANDVNYAPIVNTTRTLSKLGFQSAGKSAVLFKPDTIVVTKSGTIGRVALLKDYMCGNRAIINIETLSHDKFDTYYIYYWLCSKTMFLNSIAVGSVQKNLYVTILGNVDLDWPSYNKRQHIVNIKEKTYAKC